MDRIDPVFESSDDWKQLLGKPLNAQRPPSRSTIFSKRMGRLAILLFWALFLAPFTVQASLNLAIEINPEPAVAGDYLSVALTVSNSNAYDDLTDVVLTLPYPEHLANLHTSLLSHGGFPSSGYYCTSQGFVTWNLGTLPAGSTKTVTLPPMVADDTPTGTVIVFTPKVSDSSGNETIASRNVIVESERVLEIVLAPDAEPVQPGGIFTYTLTYGHRATSAVAPDTVLELPLPDDVSFVSATGGGTLGGNAVQWSLGTLNPGQIGRAQVTVTVDASTALGSVLTAQAVLRSTSQADIIARADSVTKVEAESSLLLSVEVLPEPAEAGEYLDIALTVSNPSGFDRSDVVLWFRYPEHLANLHTNLLSHGGFPSSGYYCTAQNFVTWNLGTLPAGSAKTVTLPPMVATDTPAGTVIELAPQVYDSSGKVIGVSRCVPVENERVLELVLAADAEPVQPSGIFTYTLTYGHRATSAVAPDTVLELPLPDDVSFVSATGGGTLGENTVQWSLGTLNPGQIGRAQVTVAVDASTPLGSVLAAQAVLRSTSQADIIARADSVTKVEAESSLLLSVEVLPEPVEAGESLDIALTVSNPSAFDRSDIVLWFRYPEHLANLHTNLLSHGGFPYSGYYCTAQNFVTWNLGTLPAGSAKTVTLPPMVEAGTPTGTVIELAPQVYDSSGKVIGVSRCIPVESERGLELVLAADAEPVPPGGIFTYTLTYGHRATSAVAPDTVLELPLPDEVSFVSATGDGTLGGNTVQWSLGTLTPGQIGRAQVTVAVDASTALGSMLAAQAVLRSTSQADIIARADNVTKVEAQSSLLLSAEVLPEPAEAGESLDIALTVSNPSTFDRSDVVLWFRYPEHLANLHANLLSDGGFPFSGYYCTSQNFVTWNLGTLPAGSSKTVTLPPMVEAATPAGTVIELAPQVSDSSGEIITVSRCVPVENERIFELRLNTDMDAIQPGDLLTYTLAYGHRNTFADVPDIVLELPLPENTSFVSATGSGLLGNDTVQWSLKTLAPGQVGRETVTVTVDSATGFGRLIKAQAILRSTSQQGCIARADAVTKVVAETPFLLSIGVVPDPTLAGEQLDAALTVTNTSAFDRSDVLLKFRYPEHLAKLHTSLLSDGGVPFSGYYCTSQYFVTWNLGTLPAGSTKTVTLPPTVDTATIDGTIIEFDAVVEDATARSRAEHTVQIGQPVPQSHMLTVEMTGDGSVTSDPAGISCPVDSTETFLHGNQVTLTAVPDHGWEFKKWTGDYTGTEPTCVLTMSEDLQVTATFIVQNIIQEYSVLNNDTPITLASRSNTLVYGCNGTNKVSLESGAIARLINFPDSNTITIQSNSSQFTVSKSGATVTFIGTDSTMLVIPATATAQSIVFNDKDFELRIHSGAVMLENQIITTESASIITN